MPVVSSEVAVVIPVYKPFSALSANERSSFRQCLRILQNYKMILVCPQSLDTSSYTENEEGQEKMMRIEKFPDKYFKNTNGYSKLLLSKKFYRRFIDAKYILIYQLDAWIFRDEVVYWCNQGYDFIGSPIFENFESNTNFEFSYALNGGFSLRNVASSIKILSRIQPLRCLHFLVKIMSFKQIKSLAEVPVFIRFKEKFRIENITYLRALLGGIHVNNEDLKWSWAAETFSDFKKPQPEVAMQFSFEFHPSFLLKKNNNKIPMGCHAWEKYEPDFWIEFIPDTSISDVGNTDKN